MTYITNKRRVRRAKPALGGITDFLFGGLGAGSGGAADMLAKLPSSKITCLDEANAKVAPLDARVVELARTWNPTGYYTPDDIAQIVPQVVSICSAATSAIAQAPLSTDDARFAKNQALDTINQKLQQSFNYTQAAKDARAKGQRAIDAPGLKQWVISTMNAASQGLVTAYVLECNMPALATWVIRFQKLFDAVAGVVKRIAGVTLAFGELAIKAVEQVPKLGAILLTVAKWGVVGVAAAYAFRKIKEARGR